ncbi:MAG: response regulator transcription factor [Faecalibacterium sp.]|nr:response regulator transcription factor [Faecalibacterium sp.]
MENSKIQILVVEDDPQIRNYMLYALKNEGYGCEYAGNAQNAMQAVVEGNFDLMLLDLGLPDYDGMEVIRKLRSFSEMPVIVVSARDQDKEKAAALDAGADDYLTKPFSSTELLARIRVSLRHLFRIHSSEEKSTLNAVGGLMLDAGRHLALLDGAEVHLTPLEYKMLTVLFQNAGKVLTSSYLLKKVWSTDFTGDTQALRALMASLRRKLEKNPAKPRYILTEIGVGYRLADE